jgi:hypothetical protein
VQEGWAVGEVSTEREFLHSRCEYYPLHQASLSRSLRDPEAWKKHLTDLQITLLKYGADPFAKFRQPLARAQPFFRFPGIVQDQDENEDMPPYSLNYIDGTGLLKYHVDSANANAAAKTMYEEMKQQQMEELGEDFDSKEFEEEFSEKYGYYVFQSNGNPSTVFDRFGIRSVTHAILEDGGFVLPILTFPGLDLEHKDPQGRTLFLSACRSPIGADAAIDGAIDDVAWDAGTPNKGGYCHNPFPQPDHLAPTPYSRTKETTTLLQFFVRRGANLLAVDNYGKHALFHLLEAHEPYSNYRPPVVRDSVRYMAKTIPQLVNQSDNAGNYPIHAAVRRLRRFTTPNRLVDAAELEASVHDLLEAGADPKVLDERGNSVMDYLSDLFSETETPTSLPLILQKKMGTQEKPIQG